MGNIHAVAYAFHELSMFIKHPILSHMSGRGKSFSAALRALIFFIHASLLF
jgi:hypothetical protein